MKISQLQSVLFAAMAGSVFVLSSCGEAAKLLTESSPVAKEVAQAIEVASGSSSSSSSSSSDTGFPANVAEIKVEANKTFEVKGNLDTGAEIQDLSWASSSSNACFPATQNARFRGNHVLYHADLPTRTTMVIKLIPDDTSQPMSLYAYQIGTTNYSVVPNLPGAVSCEADHLRDRPVRGQVEDGTRTVELRSTTNPYNAVIGVSGPAGATGGYTLQVTLE